MRKRIEAKSYKYTPMLQHTKGSFLSNTLHFSYLVVNMNILWIFNIKTMWTDDCTR